MNELTNKKYMTVAEVATALNVDERTIQRYIKKLATDLSGVQNKQGGHMLTMMDTTIIKRAIVDDANYGKVNAYHRDAWAGAYAIKLGQS